MADNTFDVNLISEETGQEIVAALKAGPGSPDIDIKALVDGTNTTELFWKFYSRLNAEGVVDRYSILERFAKAIAGAWNGKTYTLRYYDANVSQLTGMTPMDDLAGKTAAQLCTESTTVVADWADEDPMTWYIRANALSLQNGHMNVLAIEGEDTFDISGETAPVYTFALALWIKEWNDGTYNYISFRTTQGPGFYPDAGDVGPDNKKRALTWHPTFGGGLNSAGKLTSGAGIKPYIFASADTGNTKAKLWNSYEGLWNDCDTRWLLRMWQLRHFDMENGNILEGCTNYSVQYQVAAAEANVKRVLVTTAQGANFIVGSTVSVGDRAGDTSSTDRGRADLRNIADCVKISSIETVTVEGVSYSAINLEVSSPFTTTAATMISTMPWHSGSTEGLPGHKDGSMHSLTNGKNPCRIAGVEVLDGAYALGLDPLYNVTAGDDADHFNYAIYECKNSENLANSITANYVNTNLGATNVMKGWNWVKSFITTRLGVLFPGSFGGDSAKYFKSAFRGTNSAGVRCPWRFGNLNYGGYAGVACGHGGNSPGNSGWDGRPRLGGSGKKRGEWTA